MKDISKATGEIHGNNEKIKRIWVYQNTTILPNTAQTSSRFLLQ